MRNDCCWCGKDTTGGPVFSLSASFNEKGQSLTEEEGYIKDLKTSDGKEVWTMITGEKSPAKKMDRICSLCAVRINVLVS
ncbi:hypothetical protein [Halanaerobium hydrogeniformans]|uniref:Uncharacterized protein n=1 Tax=Halanaerobium hydrogeniformans TaxID=656519 RepID=E4RM35_HALHG|nr:hypothetical protein [Halanaerobium hydrogeniformans]ADQ14118.1 hypothetical protein Halsa_0667 [Halanaerobium hydrogeniformans]